MDYAYEEQPMSNGKKVTVYDKITGKFLIAGNESSNKISDLIIAGNIRVEGMQDNHTKWDFVTSLVVPNNDKIQDEADYEQKKIDDRARRLELYDLLEANYGVHTGTTDNDTIDLLNELARLV